jgi:hypothetical protein
MGRNRFVQLVAVVIALGCVLGTAALMPRIEDQRQELQLSGSDDIREKLPPKVAVATAALGSFRGLAVDVMWYRLEMLKREGKFHEANTLSQWITTLQPRFPQVWSFMAWNMAYNISVATYTPEERLDWVTKGIDLLRDQGIPYNPHAIRLYRELGWIFFHKVGQYSDDQHWYYKARMAGEWQLLLGVGGDGATSEQVIAAFRPIADAYDQYVNQQRPTREALAALDALRAGNPGWSETIDELQNLALKAFERRLTRWRATLARESPTAAARLDPVVRLIASQIERGAYTPLQLIVRGDDSAGAIAQELVALGLPPNELSLRRIGRVRVLLDSPDARAFGFFEGGLEDPVDRRIVELFTSPDSRDAMARTVAFYRAVVLSERFHMDPNWMLHLMEKYGPVDWRHSAAHSLYWSSLGVRMAGHLRNKKDVDLLNTIRGVIHSLQQLTRVGRLSFDPVSGYIDEMPDPRFVEAYELAIRDAGEEIQKEVWGGGTIENFDAGYENFLIDAVRTHFLYGDEAQARRYYNRARDLFRDKLHNVSARGGNNYDLPLDQFVTKQLIEDIDMQMVVRPFIDGFLRQGMVQGLGNNRQDVYERFRALALNVHTRYQQKAIANPTAMQDRMALRPFREIEENTFIEFLVAEGVDMLMRVRIWRNTPMTLRQSIYDRIRPALARQTEQMELSMERAFPAPPGMLLRDPTTAQQRIEDATRPSEVGRIQRQ